MPLTPSGADELANTLLDTLTDGVDFTVPEIDLSGAVFQQPANTGQLYADINPIGFEELTTGEVGGTGVFDKLMISLVNHLKVEYGANRISGAEYTKAYLGVITAALGTAQQFLLAKDQAYWSALLVQAQARTADVDTIRARIALETARVEAARMQYDALSSQANYASMKIKLSIDDISYTNLSKEGLNLDKQGTMLTSQNLQVVQQTSNMVTEGANLVKQGTLLTTQNLQVAQQTENLDAQKTGIDYTNANILPAQKSLLSEQTEVQRAQTSDTRLSGGAIAGAVKKQKDLYDQQITSYQRDSEYKATKIFSDAWVAMRTIDEEFPAPTQFNEANINDILTQMRVKLNID